MSHQSWKIDGKNEISTNQASVSWENDRFFTIHHKGQIFHGELMDEQLENRMIKLKINHREFVVSKEGPLDQLIEELGLNKLKVRKLHHLKSLMPGRVVAVAVQIGQEVQPGVELLTLEAMKMENVLKSEGVGIVKSIEVQANDVVDKGAVLITFE